MSTATRVIDRLRRPEFTGENRCVPCTAVNLVIAAALSLAVAVFVPLSFAPWLGAAVLTVSLAAIALRGYLVPGTPWFTRTYFPDWLLRWFEKEPMAVPTTEEGDVDAEAVLVGSGVLTECATVDDLCLAEPAREAWRERIEALQAEDTSVDDLAVVLGVPRERLTVEEFGDAFVARDDGVRVGQWESRAAFLADVAAAPVLADRVDAWETLEVAERGSLLTGLRLFVERCPACGGDVDVEDDVVKSCCRSFDVVAATCVDCEARLFEAELAQSA